MGLTIAAVGNWKRKCEEEKLFFPLTLQRGIDSVIDDCPLSVLTTMGNCESMASVFTLAIILHICRNINGQHFYSSIAYSIVEWGAIFEQRTIMKCKEDKWNCGSFSSSSLCPTATNHRIVVVWKTQLSSLSPAAELTAEAFPLLSSCNLFRYIIPH